MSITIISKSDVSSASGSTGHTHRNLDTLNLFNIDSDGAVTFNGQKINEISLEVNFETNLSQKNIQDKCIEIPNDCDTNKAITVILESVPQRKGDDWEVIAKTYPEKDLIAWEGLGMEFIVQVNDRISICYYKKI